MKNNSDILLLRRLKDDDYSSFNIIYERYWEGLFLFAFRLSRDKETATQLTQDLFVQLWEKRHRNDIKNLKSYLYQSIKYQFFQMYKSRDRRIEELSASFEKYISENIDEFHPEILIYLSHALDILPERRKEILLLNKYHDMRPGEIAELLGLSTQTVRNQIVLAINQLREYFSEKSVKELYAVVLTILLR